MCHMYTWCVVGTTVDMSSFKWCQMDCRWFWAWATAVATRWVTQFHRQKCSIKNCKVSKTCEVWNLKRKCVQTRQEIWEWTQTMKVSSWNNGDWFCWIKDVFSSLTTHTSVKSAFQQTKFNQKGMNMNQISSSTIAAAPDSTLPGYYLFALLCHPCFTFTPHPWPPLNFPFKVTGHGGFVLFALFQITKFQ